MDMAMPVMDGLDATDDYLSKPIIKANLALTMEKWIATKAGDASDDRSDIDDNASKAS